MALDRHRLHRTTSLVALPTYTTPAGRFIETPTTKTIAVIKRSYSVPDISAQLALSGISGSYPRVRQLGLSAYRTFRDWSWYDDLWESGFYYKRPLYEWWWPYSYLSSYRYYDWPYRYNYTDLYPKRYTYSDTYSPLWYKSSYTYDFPYRSYSPYVNYRYPSVYDYEYNDKNRGYDLYGKGLITRNDLERFWLAPSYGTRRRITSLHDDWYTVPRYRIQIKITGLRMTYFDETRRLRRSSSVVVLPGARITYAREPTALKRSVSVTDLSITGSLARTKVVPKYRSSGLSPYRGFTDAGMWDYGNYNPYTYLSSYRGWPYNYSPSYPGLYSWDAYSPYWYKYWHPYDKFRPWWSYTNDFRYPGAWDLESVEVSRAHDLYTKGLIARNALEKYWITPSYGARKYSALYDYMSGLPRYKVRA